MTARRANSIQNFMISHQLCEYESVVSKHTGKLVVEKSRMQASDSQACPSEER